MIQSNLGVDSDDAEAWIGMYVVFGVGPLAFVTNIREGRYPVGSKIEPIENGNQAYPFLLSAANADNRHT